MFFSILFIFTTILIKKGYASSIFARDTREIGTGDSLTERSVLLTENVEAGGLERHVVRSYNVSVRRQVQPIMELPEEVRDAGVRFRQRLQHHLGLRAAMLGQQDLAEPSLADDLQDVELFYQIHLRQEAVSRRRVAVHGDRYIVIDVHSSFVTFRHAYRR